MSESLLKAEPRAHLGTRFSRRYRREGKVPGVFYIHSEEPISLLFDYRKLTNFLNYNHALVDLEIEGEKTARKCVIKDTQYDPVTDRIMHVDFLGVKMGEKLTLEVSLQLVGQPEGLKMGAILEHLIRQVTIACLPKDLPDHLEVDVSQMEIGDSLQIKDLSFENIEILHEPSDAVVLLEIPKVVALDEPEEEIEEGEEGDEEDGEEQDEDDAEKE